jgi:hypothetical protein
MTCLVKISFVTAAMLYLSRRARQSCSIRAVLPDPTGLHVLELLSLTYLAHNVLLPSFFSLRPKTTHYLDRPSKTCSSCVQSSQAVKSSEAKPNACEEQRAGDSLPPNPHCKGPFVPISSGNQRHLAQGVRTRPIQNLV